MTARALAKYIDDTELGEIDEEQVEFFRSRIFEAAEYKGEFRPDHVIRYISRLIKRPEYSFNKTEETMTELITELNGIRDQYKELIHLPKVNGHYLAKAIELRTMIDMLEMMFMVFKTRKESRGCFSRLDYPERDDRNWLKWVIVDNKSEDGKPHIFTERIPIERYPFKPEGWEEIAIPKGN
jgi:succinate dehydrogenase/fumarate reductase flavoprotein subunit